MKRINLSLPDKAIVFQESTVLFCRIPLYEETNIRLYNYNKPCKSAAYRREFLNSSVRKESGTKFASLIVSCSFPFTG